MSSVLAVGLLPQGDAADSVEDALGVAGTGLQVAGTIAFATSATLVAGQKRMNVLGVFSVLVAVGGGTLRDILLGDLPVYWVTDPVPLVIAAVTTALTIPLFGLGTISLIQRYGLVRLFDSVGLALFVIVGTNIALDSGAGAISAVVVGVVAGVGGGIIRDNLADKVPEALASGHFYASAAIVGSALNIALLETSIRPAFASAIAATFIFAARMLSIHYGWGLPEFKVEDDDQNG